MNEIKWQCEHNRRVTPRELLNAIKQGEYNIMSALSDAVKQLTDDNAQLSAEVDAVVSVIQGIPAAVSKAVADALASAGVDSTASTDAVNAVDVAVKAETAKLTAAIAPVPAPAG